MAGMVTFAAALKPLSGFSEITTLPVWPCLIVTGFGAAASVKSGPAATLTVTGTLPDWPVFGTLKWTFAG